MFAELTLQRRKSSLDLDPEQQLADVHLQDTLTGDQEELQEDAEHDDEEVASPEEAVGTAPKSGAGPVVASCAPWCRLPLFAALMWVSVLQQQHRR